MAKVEFKIPDDFLQRLSRLESRMDEIVPRVLEAGGQVALAKVKSNLQSVVGKNLKTKPSRSTGQLVNALDLSPAKMDRQGNFNVKVGFDEPRRGKASNALIANVIEYGKHGQPPNPFLKPAKSASRTPAIEAMKRKLEEEMGDV